MNAQKKLHKGGTKMFKQYFTEREKKQKHEDYKNGLGWAMAEYYCDNVSLGELKRWSAVTKDFDLYNSFDEGVDKAIDIIKKHKGGTKMKDAIIQETKVI